MIYRVLLLGLVAALSLEAATITYTNTYQYPQSTWPTTNIPSMRLLVPDFDISLGTMNSYRARGTFSVLGDLRIDRILIGAPQPLTLTTGITMRARDAESPYSINMSIESSVVLPMATPNTSYTFPGAVSGTRSFDAPCMNGCPGKSFFLDLGFYKTASDSSVNYFYSVDGTLTAAVSVTYDYTSNVHQPEPSTFILMLSGTVLGFFYIRKKKT